MSTGPTDHARFFIPGTDEHRDLTPLPQADGTLAFDIALHPTPGPLSTWMGNAEVGATVRFGGPRGSKGIPVGARHLLLVGDDSALPSMSRWIAESPDDLGITVVAAVAEADRAYLPTSDRVATNWLDSVDDLVHAVRTVAVNERTFVFAAGEAGVMRELRRYWRRELGLPAAQVAVNGYWRRGTCGYDHHEPLDPSDPDR